MDRSSFDMIFLLLLTLSVEVPIILKGGKLWAAAALAC